MVCTCGREAADGCGGATTRKNGREGTYDFGLDWERTEVEVKVCRALEKVAAEVGVGSNIRAGEWESSCIAADI